MTEREPSYTVGGNVNWCNHYGKQYGGEFEQNLEDSEGQGSLHSAATMESRMDMSLSKIWETVKDRKPSMLYSMELQRHDLVTEQQQHWRFLKKLKVELPYNPAIPLLSIYPEKTLIWRHMHPNVQSCTIYNSQDMVC